MTSDYPNSSHLISAVFAGFLDLLKISKVLPAKEIETLGTNKFDMKKQSLSNFYSNNKTEMYKYLTQELSTPPVRKKFNLTGCELLKLLLSVDILIVYS